MSILPVLDDASVAEAVDLKARLVDLAQQPQFSRILRLRRREGAERGIDPQALSVWAVDTLIHQHRYDDGSRFLDRLPTADLTEWQLSLLEAWDDQIEGTFEVVERDGAWLRLRGLYDDLDYVVCSNAGPEALGPLAKGWFLKSAMVPLRDAWMLTGTQRLLGPSYRDGVAEEVLATFAMRPDLVLRNPERRAEAERLTKQSHAWFLEAYGTDRIVGTEDEIEAEQERFAALVERRSAEKKVVSEPASTQRQAAPVEDGVALWSHETTGLWMFYEYGVFAETFAEPRLARDGRHRRVVRDFLDDDRIPRWVFEVLAEEFADTYDAAWCDILRRPSFTWATDGAALLDKHKPQRDHGPLVLPVPEIARRLGR